MKLRAPKDTKRVSFAGVEYAVAADGTVDVPGMAVEPLMAHGFVRVGADGPGQAASPASGPAAAATAARPTGVLRKGA